MCKKIGITLAVTIFLINSASGATPQKMKVTNVRDTQFTISWVTDESESGWVNYGTSTAPGKTSKIGYDDRGSQTTKDTHHVTITGLLPETTYFYKIVSGTMTDENFGSVTTGISIIPVGSDVVYGRVFTSDSKNYAEGAICYITIKDADGMGSNEDSALVSVLVDKNGYWFTELVNFREANLNKLFKYSKEGDNLCIYVEGGDKGRAELIVNTADDSPAPDIILGN